MKLQYIIIFVHQTIYYCIQKHSLSLMHTDKMCLDSSQNKQSTVEFKEQDNNQGSNTDRIQPQFQNKQQKFSDRKIIRRNKAARNIKQIELVESAQIQYKISTDAFNGKITRKQVFNGHRNLNYNSLKTIQPTKINEPWPKQFQSKQGNSLEYLQLQPDDNLQVNPQGIYQQFNKKLNILNDNKQHQGQLAQIFQCLACQIMTYKTKCKKYKQLSQNYQIRMLQLEQELRLKTNQLNNYNTICKAKIQANITIKNLQITRMAEQLASNQHYIQQLQQRIKMRNKCSNIVIQQLQVCKQQSKKRTQRQINSNSQMNLLQQNQKLIKKTKAMPHILEQHANILRSKQQIIEKLNILLEDKQNQIKDLNNKIIKMAIKVSSLQKQNDLISNRLMKSIIKQQKLQKILKNQEGKIHELGSYIMQLILQLNPENKRSQEIASKSLQSGVYETQPEFTEN